MTDFVAGDTGSTLQTTCIDSVSFSPIILTNYSIAIQWRDSAKILRSKNMEKVNAVAGIVQYTFVAGELEAPNMQFDIVLTHNTSGNTLTCKDIVRIIVRDRV
jgi:hypothetical protein